MSNGCLAANEETSVNRLFSFADRDIYGFPLAIHNPAPAKTEKRDKKWDEFFGLLRRSASDGNAKNGQASQLVTLLRKGLPCNKRVAVWKVLSKSTQRQRTEDKRYDDKYYDMLKRQVEATGNVLVFDQIEKDLRRTFPGNPFFESEVGQHKLRSVLRCFAIHSLRYVDAPRIGYCQSLNYVAGVLLLLTGEEEAFYLLLQLVEGRLPRRYYCAGMEDIIIDQHVLLSLFRLKFPDLSKHFERLQVPLELVATRWLLCLFVNCVPIETVLRIWDCLFFWGSDMLFRVILAAVKLNYAALMARTDACDAIACLTESLRNMHDPDLLIKTCFEAEADFHSRTLEQLRAKERDSRRHLDRVDYTSWDSCALTIPSHHPFISLPLPALSPPTTVESPPLADPLPPALSAPAGDTPAPGVGGATCLDSAAAAADRPPTATSIGTTSNAATGMTPSVPVSLLDHPLLQLPAQLQQPPLLPRDQQRPRAPHLAPDVQRIRISAAMSDHFTARFVPDPSKSRNLTPGRSPSLKGLVRPTTVRACSSPPPPAAHGGSGSTKERERGAWPKVHWLARVQDTLTMSLVDDYIK